MLNTTLARLTRSSRSGLILDRQHDIAAWFGVNPWRIAEVASLQISDQMFQGLGLIIRQRKIGSSRVTQDSQAAKDWMLRKFRLRQATRQYSLDFK